MNANPLALESPTPAVVGLDLSLTATGIAHPDGTTTTVKTRQRDGDLRLVQIATAVREVAGDGHRRVDLAVLEDLPQHAKAAGITGMVHGAVRAVLLDLGVPYATIAPATLKAYATGSGKGDKTPMAIAALKRAGREFDGDTGGNECDAWWLRQAGMDWLGTPEIDLPKAQRERLTKAKWPHGAVGR